MQLDAETPKENTIDTLFKDAAGKRPPHSRKVALGVTAAILPIIYFTVYIVLTSPAFSSDLKAMVVGTVIGSLMGSITGYWFGGTDDKSNSSKPTATEH